MYQVCCFDCVDSKYVFNSDGSQIEKDETEKWKRQAYFADKSDGGPILSLIVETYSSETNKIYYHRGFGRDKFQQTSLSIILEGFNEDEFVIADSIRETGEIDLYEYIRKRLER